MEYSLVSLRPEWKRLARKYWPELVQDFNGLGYASIIRGIKEYNPKDQEWILSELFGKLPEGKRIAEALYRLINIPWGQSEGMTKMQKERARKSWRQHLNDLRPFAHNGKIRTFDDWVFAKEDASEDVYHLDFISLEIELPEGMKNAVHMTASAASETMVEEEGSEDKIPRRMEETLQLDASCYAAYEAVRGLGVENPFEHLMRIYQKGVLIDESQGKPVLVARTGDPVSLFR